MALLDVFPAAWQPFVKQYIILLVAGAGVLLFIVVTMWRDQRRRQQLVEDSLRQVPVPTIRQVLAAPKPQPDFRVYDPTGAARPATHDPLLERVRTLSDALREDHAVLNAGMIDDYRRLYAQTQELDLKLEEIRAHGVELGRLYGKYKERRIQLVAMLHGMHRLLDQPAPAQTDTQPQHLYSSPVP